VSKLVFEQTNPEGFEPRVITIDGISWDAGLDTLLEEFDSLLKALGFSYEGSLCLTSDEEEENDSTN